MLTDAVIAALDRAYIFIDLEVDPAKDRLFRVGMVSTEGSSDYLGEPRLQQALARLRHAKMTSRLHICGHNSSRFDAPRLAAEWSELRDWPTVDTLELSMLAFPWQYSHRLSKDYKADLFTTNNPRDDAAETRVLLYRILSHLAIIPEPLRNAYVWLLTCGDTLADHAYQRLFSILDWRVDDAPAYSSLPLEVTDGLDVQELRRLLRAPDRKDFDARLCVAGILAWNTERATRSTGTFPAWLTHLPPFQSLLDTLRPLQPAGFTYQPFLEYFGYQEFRGKQEDAVRAIVEHKNPLILMPTGGGKSLCFQIPALMLYQRQGALTVVISPLQALMEDQVRDLEEHGLTFATFINGTLSSVERQERMDQLWQGEKGLLYISPEQLRSFGMRALLRNRYPALWVVDEAHCVSQWGHDFRTDYLYMPKFLRELQGDRSGGQRQMPLALVTATATHEVREDIHKVFAEQGFHIGATIDGGSQRPNLEWQVLTDVGDKDQEIVRLVREQSASGGAVLVYTTTRKQAERLAALLRKHGIEARHFHAKVAREEKREILEQFKGTTSPKLNVVTATCAFGMGINRPDVRAVIHNTMSANLEGYVQEAGRAGRDNDPAKCILLHKPEDAETIFYLDSLKHVSEVDLTRLFEATRKIRDRVFTGASDKWFWVTSADLMPLEVNAGGSDSDDEEDRRDTKVKVALHYLEQFGLTERLENLSNFIAFDLVCETLDQAVTKLQHYATENNFSTYQIETFTRLIHAMYAAKAALANGEGAISLDGLSEEAQIASKELVNRIQTLQQAGVCRYELPITLLVRKGVRSAQSGEERDAKRALEQIHDVERLLLDEIEQRLESQGTSTVRLHLRGLVQKLDPNGDLHIRASLLREMLNAWAARRWLSLRNIGKDEVRVGEFRVGDHLEIDHYLGAAIVDSIYDLIEAQDGPKIGARLRIQLELAAFAAEVSRRLALFATTAEELSAALLTLNRRKVIRIVDGLQFFQQALRVRVVARAAITAIHRSYHIVQEHYAAQTRRTHIMLHYGTLADAKSRANFVDDYFKLAPSAFAAAYPELSPESTGRPLTQADYQQIMGCLTTPQREIVEANDAAIAVVAGPGSGKTRTITHRIAYLMKVKRVDPERIIALAYNRNAVYELRKRLRALVGPNATRLRVYTFHGLALRLLGRAIGESQGSGSVQFNELVPRACQLLEHGDEFFEEDEDTQARRLRLLGDVEYIFVDEYQDVNADYYRFIKLLSGLDDGADETRRVHINLCVIGDDDQNIFEWNGTSTQYIQNVEQEYGARRMLLVENFRSTPPIIAATNSLIRHNLLRCKVRPEEQVYAAERSSEDCGSAGDREPALPVRALLYNTIQAQTVGVSRLIHEHWLRADAQPRIQPGEIAVLARTWEELNDIRLELADKGIATHALRDERKVRFLFHRATFQLVEALRADLDRVWGPYESIAEWMRTQLPDWGRGITEPTVRILLRLLEQLDLERGFASADDEEPLPITANEILTALYEFHESCKDGVDQAASVDAVQVSTFHGAKGLEFRRVVVLSDNLRDQPDKVEAERRLLYVGMSRAQEELCVSTTQPNSRWMREIGVQPRAITLTAVNHPQFVVFEDLTLGDVNIGYVSTRKMQTVIERLRENAPLRLVPNESASGWVIEVRGRGTRPYYQIGALSKDANARLRGRHIIPGQFEFRPGEVTVQAIFHHLLKDPVSREIIEDWFVPIPRIRIFRQG